ncbi:MAG: hypothetical protein P4L35_00735 [Ignavibacteriaceae bacterium]|nr:hypothetical protein [Ignavibacteriaceae bacterium]
MIFAKAKIWIHNYNIVLYLAFILFGWIILWGAWMLFIMIAHPH